MSALLKVMNGRSTTPSAVRLLALLLLLTLPTAVQAQFNCTTNNGTITITGYTGSGGDVAIPSTVTGLPVTSVGDYAFSDSSLTSVSIPSSVTNIGNSAFYQCISLSAITVDALNSFYSSVDGVLFNKNQTTLIYCPPGKFVASYTVPNGVTGIENRAFSGCSDLTSVSLPSSLTSIGSYAFYDCSGLTSISIPNSVASIEDSAFAFCTKLTGVYCKGNAPSLGSSVFDGANNATVYYLPWTTGWGTTFGARPVVCWNPQVPTSDLSFGVRTNRFGFTIAGTSGLIIVVDACTNLTTSLWLPVQTNTLTQGSVYFSDPLGTNSPNCFYRLRMP